MLSDREAWVVMLNMLEEQYQGYEDIPFNRTQHEFLYALGLSSGIRSVLYSIKNLIDPKPQVMDDVQQTPYRISADEYARSGPAPA